MGRAYAELHAAVLLAGLTAVLGEVIALSALPLVWWRVVLATGSFATLVAWEWKRSPDLATAAVPWGRLLAIGGVVGLHWVTFYGGVKLANASVAVLCFALVSPFTALLEPLVARRRIDWGEVGLGALVLPGMALVVGVVRPDYYAGIGVGVLSALLAALFAIANKRTVDTLAGAVPAVLISAAEMAGAALLLTAAWPLLAQLDLGGGGAFWPRGRDWAYLAVLVLACTTLAFLLQLRSLRHLSAFAANLAYGLEPVYGVLLAAVLLRQDQELGGGFYAGAALIALAVLAHPALARRRRARSGRPAP